MLYILQRLRAAYRNFNSHQKGDQPMVLAHEIQTLLHTGAAYRFGLADTYSLDSGKLPVVIIVPGWGSKIFSSRTYTEAASRLRALGYHTMSLSLRGHEGSKGDLDTVTRRNHAEDIKAALQHVLERPEVDRTCVCVFGTSYGAYMLASSMPISNLRLVLFRAPALYPDQGWDQPNVTKDPNLAAWREVPHAIKDSVALRGLAAYKGAIKIVWSEFDEQMPKAVLDSYVDAILPGDVVEVQQGAKHQMSREELAEFFTMLEQFFRNNYPKSLF